eukprot:gene7849-9321_t
MRKTITVGLVFLATFLVTFNVVRNVSTLHRSRTNEALYVAEDVFATSTSAQNDVASFPPPPPPPPPLEVAQPSEEIGRDSCHVEEHAEYWGDVVKWGNTFTTPTAGDCCQACKDFVSDNPEIDGCNTWVWCPNPNGCNGQKHLACWLKYNPHPEAPPVSRGPLITWTSGALYQDRIETKNPNGGSRKFHVAVTANDAKYVQWQMRVMYYHYKKIKAAQGPDGHMGGFTRILHSGRPDSLMDEIPSFVTSRLKNEYGFVVLSRPSAFVEWLQKTTIEEDYIFMSEPDHLYLRPIPNFMIGDKPAAFPFFYIAPKEFPDLIRKYVGNITTKQIHHMDPIGNSPVIIHKKDLTAVAPLWHEMAVAMKTDPVADKAWGWVLEMYAYTCACEKLGIHHDLIVKFQAQ